VKINHQVVVFNAADLNAESTLLPSSEDFEHLRGAGAGPVQLTDEVASGGRA
jgi:hypothetical protein